MSKQRKYFPIVIIILIIPITIFSQEYLDLNGNGSKEPYEDPSLSPERRAQDLISRMTLPQKVHQMNHSRTDAIIELGIPEYYWWLEALHGLRNSIPVSTQFPQNIGIAATWDLNLIEEIYSAISDECRAFYNEGYNSGLNYYSPAVLGVMRDKRWQRCEESFGEDPFLISQLAATTYKAFQGFGESKYLKVIATAKHFVSNRGPLGRDHEYAEFSGPASERITREVCFEPYKAAIREGYVGEFMSAYSGRPTGLDWNGNPCAVSHLLLTEILRDEWHFKGHVTSDCWALWQIIESEGYTDETVISKAVQAGVDLICGRDYAEALITAVINGSLSEDYIDQALERLFTSRFKTGEFDPAEMVPYSDISLEVVASPEHINLALQTARESIVLLKNEDDILPLNKNNLESLAIIGPAANEVHLGGYSGSAPYTVSPYQGILNKVVNTVTTYAAFTTNTQEASEAAENSDIALVVLGPSPGQEDITQADLSLPEGQLEMIQAVVSTGTPTIAILINGNPLSSQWVKENVEGIIEAWYPGMEGGNAIADVLFGDYNPSGHLPWSIPREDLGLLYYDTKGEVNYDWATYLWPFGFGLSYTSFEYSNLQVSGGDFNDENDCITIQVDVQNTGEFSGSDVVQLYIGSEDASVPRPEKELKGFSRITLDPGETTTVDFTIKPNDIKYLDDNMEWGLEPGNYKIMIGKSCEEIVLEDHFQVTTRISLPGFYDKDLKYLEVTFVSPTSSTVLDAGDSIMVEVLPQCNKTSVDSINLYINGNYISSKSNSPYKWNQNGDVEQLNNLQGKNVTLKAVAFGSEGETSKSLLTLDILKAHNITNRIEAEDFITQSGIQIEETEDIGGGYNIGYIENGDWTEYIVSVPTTGIYILKIRVATNTSGGTINISSDGKQVGSLDVQDSESDGWQDWYTDSVKVTLEQGNHNFRLDFAGGSGYLFNINWFEANFASETSVPDEVYPAREVQLTHNYPNPFNPETTIEYQLPKSTRVTLKVFDIRGREVLTLVNEKQQPGNYKIKLDSQNLPSGTYFYQLKTDDQKICKRMLILK